MNKSEALKMYLNTNSVHYYKNDDSEHVFVYNEYDKYSAGNKKSIIIIPLNENFTIRIPITKLPIDLTEQAPKEEIINNKLFMENLTKKYLRICTEEEAFKKLEDPDAIKEMERLKESNPINLDELYNREQIEVKDIEAINNKTPETLEVNLTIMETLAREDIPEEEKLSTVKTLEDSLTDQDWKYIYENSDGKIKALALDHME